MIDDYSIKVGGKQNITTNDGFKIPISIKDSLPYIPLRSYADSEWDTLPHVVLTSDIDQNPIVLDYPAKDNEEWFDTQSNIEGGLNSELFDEFGNYCKRTQVNE